MLDILLQIVVSVSIVVLVAGIITPSMILSGRLSRREEKELEELDDNE